MTYISKLAASILVSIVALGGIANAGEADKVRIIRMDSISNDATSMPIGDRSDAEIAATQSSIGKSLASELRARNVSLRNVIKIDTFANGAINVYVR